MYHALESVAAFLKGFLRPVSVSFVVLALTVGVLLTWSRRLWRIAPLYWLLLLVLYAGLAMPPVAEWLDAAASSGIGRLERASDAQGAKTIVVLGAGSRTYRDGAVAVDMAMPGTVMRTMEGARLYHLLGSPTVILSGGVTDVDTPDARPESEAMRNVILTLGVPPEKVVLESISKTTRTEAEAVRDLLGNRRADPIVLVTSPSHMRRSLATFEAAGLKPIPAAARSLPDRLPRGCRWCPSHDALELSDGVIYEQFAWWYYWLHGWLRGSG